MANLIRKKGKHYILDRLSVHEDQAKERMMVEGCKDSGREVDYVKGSHGVTI